MKILCLSDLHFGKKAWGAYGYNKVQEAIKLAKQTEVDVLYFGGDLADTEEGFVEGLNLLRSIPTKHRLFVTGNNDVDLLTGPLSKYVQEMQMKVGNDFHVLDDHPVHIDGIKFVGCLLGYNGSLWRPTHCSTTMPNDFHSMKIHTEKYWFEYYKNRADMSPEEFYQSQLSWLLKNSVSDRCVVGTHYPPASQFILYDTSAKFDYLNWFVGADLQSLYPKALIGFCGHTHRSGSVSVNNTVVHNVSGQSQPYVHTV